MSDANYCHKCQYKGYISIGVLKDKNVFYIKPCSCQHAKPVKWFKKLNESKFREPKDKRMYSSGYYAIDKETYTEMRKIIIKRMSSKLTARDIQDNFF